jgi:IclR family acetate operon transcriptional repressor
MEQPLGSDRAFVQPGRRLPLHAAASGKAILAFQGEDFITRYLARPRIRYTERTKVDNAEIRREMSRIREYGMAVCENELDAGVLSYGHPVPADDGHVLYSIGMTGLADRFHRVARSRIRDRLSKAAADLSRNLGFVA